MDRCGKCACSMPPGTGRIRRIEVGSVGTRAMEQDTLLCTACASEHDKLQGSKTRGWLIIVAIAVIVAVANLVWDNI